MHNRIARQAVSISHWLILALALLLFAGACAPGEESGVGEEREDKLKVVSTVSPITSLVENIGGTRIDVEGIVRRSCQRPTCSSQTAFSLRSPPSRWPGPTRRPAR